MKKKFQFLGYLVLACIVSFYTLGGGFGSLEADFTIGERPIVFAHRGVPVNTVENSTESFELSLKLGFRAIETDIRSTKDGTLVIFHDQACKRLLGKEGKIQDFTWEEVNDSFLHHEGKATRNRIKRVKEFLNEPSYSDIVYLDLKKPSIEVLDRLIGMVDEGNSYKNIYIADENLFYLAYLKFQNPKLNTILEGFNSGKEFIHYLIPKNFKPDFYASFLSGVDEDHMEFLKENKLVDRRIVYGINSENLDKARALGIKHIVLDYEPTQGSLSAVEASLIKD